MKSPTKIDFCLLLTDEFHFYRKEIMGMLKFLTVVELDELNDALEYVVKKAMKLRGARKQKEKLNTFFHYFRKQWMTPRLRNFWNYTGVEGWEEKMYVDILYDINHVMKHFITLSFSNTACRGQTICWSVTTRSSRRYLVASTHPLCILRTV